MNGRSPALAGHQRPRLPPQHHGIPWAGWRDGLAPARQPVSQSAACVRVGQGVQTQRLPRAPRRRSLQDGIAAGHALSRRRSQDGRGLRLHDSQYLFPAGLISRGEDFPLLASSARPPDALAEGALMALSRLARAALDWAAGRGRRSARPLYTASIGQGAIWQGQLSAPWPLRGHGGASPGRQHHVAMSPLSSPAGASGLLFIDGRQPIAAARCFFQDDPRRAPLQQVGGAQRSTPLRRRLLAAQPGRQLSAGSRGGSLEGSRARPSRTRAGVPLGVLRLRRRLHVTAVLPPAPRPASNVDGQRPVPCVIQVPTA